MIMISLLIINKNFLGRGTALSPLRRPLSWWGQQNLKYLRIPEICIKMCHFKIKSSKIFLGGRGHSPSPDSTPRRLRPLSFVLYSYTYMLL